MTLLIVHCAQLALKASIYMVVYAYLLVLMAIGTIWAHVINVTMGAKSVKMLPTVKLAQLTKFHYKESVQRKASVF